MSSVAMTDLVVETTQGPLSGKEKAGVLQFCGIPYAAPPVGELRFQRAQPAAPWRHVRDCTRFGPAAPQLPSGGMTDRVPVKWDEDCLSLNVCTPAIDSRQRPVLVWIHGGAYRSGQGAVPWYNGTSFALQGDLVVVSINYRLGALGFTDLARFGADYATAGANGTLDQIAALKWVKNNIERFGGDPRRVTIAGESAGAFSVATLLASPLAQGLCQRAILQSGATHHTLPPEVGARVADLLLEELGVDSMPALQAKTPLEILQAQGRADARYTKEGLGKGVMAFYPVEGNQVLPKPPLELMQTGSAKTIPVLAGTNKDEATLFIMDKVSEAALQRQAAFYGGGEQLVAAYRSLYPEADATTLAINMRTDYAFKLPTLRLAELRAAQGADTWLYQFDWESRAPHLKATHALEIPFTFNTLKGPGVRAFIGEGDLPQALADEMHQAWIAFIQGGDPGWPLYHVKTKAVETKATKTRAVKHFNTQSSLVEDGYAAISAAWEGIR